MVELPRWCPRCGQGIPSEQVTCPRCDEAGKWWALPRDTVLLLTFPVLVLLFTVTGIAARFYHAKHKSLSEQWYARGEASLKAGQAERAIEDLRAALVYAHDNSQYRLRLAQALLAANREDEAQAYLLTLWEQEPGNGTVNLELARLAAQKGSFADAVGYFHGAIFGVWEEDPGGHRREVRLELCRFLLDHGAEEEARAALIELATDLPRDAALYSRVGGLFLKAGDYPRALELFRRALQLERQQKAALAGAGEASFQTANYREARRYLERAVRLNPENGHAAQLLETANLVLASDPLERGLSSAERARRVVRAFGQATKRLTECAAQRGAALEGPPPLTQLQAVYARAVELRPRVRERPLRSDTDLMMNTLERVFEMEELAARHCGAPTGVDLALLLVARKRGGS